LGTDDDDYDHLTETVSNDGDENVTELNEVLDDKGRNISGDNTLARSTAKRKKSEKDC
jgi:hypothetical protein